MNERSKGRKARKQMHSVGRSDDIWAGHLGWSRPAGVRIQRAQAELCPKFAADGICTQFHAARAVRTMKVQAMV